MFRIGLLAPGRRLPAPIECILDAVLRAPKRLTRSAGIFWSSLIPNASPRERSI